MMLTASFPSFSSSPSTVLLLETRVGGADMWMQQLRSQMYRNEGQCWCIDGVTSLLL